MTHDELAALEAETIRAFVHEAADAGYLSGPVLDYGCGTGPYRRLVEEHGGIYYPYDRRKFLGNVSKRDVGELLPTYESVLCTQVIQYVVSPVPFAATLFDLIKKGGHLVMTYPTAWPELRDELWRFTRIGMERLLSDAGFWVVEHRERFVIPQDGFQLVVGYGVVARA